MQFKILVSGLLYVREYNYNLYFQIPFIYLIEVIILKNNIFSKCRKNMINAYKDTSFSALDTIDNLIL